jgi:two-component system, NarL family, response regulator LiaR
MDTNLRLLVVDDHTLIRQILQAALESHPYMQIVGEAATGAAALDLARRLTPDVVVLDLGLPDMNGVEVTRRLRAELPTTEVVILTSSERDDELLAALQAGAKGYVLKSSDYSELVRAVENIGAGQAILPPEVVIRVLAHLPQQSPASMASRAVPSRPTAGEATLDLSEREVEVLRQVVTGASNRQIADALALSENTVRSYLTHIMQKLNAENRVQVATYAVRHGLVSPAK